MGKIKIKYAYCDYCKREIPNPIRRPLDELEKTIVVISIIATLGFGGIAWLIYHYGIRKKNYCPDCESKLTLSKDPFVTYRTTTEAATPKEKVLEKVEEVKKEKPVKEIPEEEEEEDTIFCTFCGHELSEDYVTCPYCKTALKF